MQNCEAKNATHSEKIHIFGPKSPRIDNCLSRNFIKKDNVIISYLAMRSFLVLCIILALFDKLTSLRHPRILQHVQKNARNISPLHLKKIADEESKIKSDGGVSSKKGKEDKKGRKSNDNDDWRSKKKQNVGDQVASSPAITTPPAEEISRDDPSPKIEELLAAEAAAERALAEESVSMTEAVAAIESDSNSAQDTLKFIETMSMAGAGESSEMSTDGLLDNGRKEGRNRQMNDNDNMRLNPLDALLQVPKKNPLSGGILPPEVVFFGEPRRPPPVSSATSTTYQASLLYWARHGNSVPRDSMERMDRVFPKGRAEENASKYRLGEVELSFEAILKSWIAIMDNLEEAKAFICANVDLVPSKLFLRALTAKKLAAQSKGDVAEMNRIKDIRGKYILAHDQVYFPLNIERLKAETRVMTYLARDEIRNFARSWDSVEMSLHMTALIAARLQWDSKAEQMLDNIKARLSQTVDYMAEKTYNNLMNREFRRPSITAETYRNASLALEGTMPDLYGKIHPEVKLLHETYTLMGDEEYSKVKQYIEQVFCPREGVSVDELKVLLKLFDANLAAIQVRNVGRSWRVWGPL